MSLSSALTPEFFEWIARHASCDPARLRLKYAGKQDEDSKIDIPLAILQVECRQRFGKKLQAILSENPVFIFPTALSGEQCSSCALARYHRSLAPPGCSRVLDLTAGLGIDAMEFISPAHDVTALEQNLLLTEALRHNSNGKIQVVNTFCEDWLRENKNLKFDLIFVDPARRDSSDEHKRLYALSVCRPDILSLLPQLGGMTRRLVVKASPMLDISHTLDECEAIHRPTSIIAAGTSTECKELLIVFDYPAARETDIRGVTLDKEGAVISEVCFPENAENLAPALDGGRGIKAGDFLLEPYPAIMKTGFHRALAAEYKLMAFEDNTRLYYSLTAPTDFPGETFRVTEVMEYASRNIKRFKRSYPQIGGVTARNFGLSAQELINKLGISQKGSSNTRLFALTARDHKRLLIIAEKIS